MVSAQLKNTQLALDRCTVSIIRDEKIVGTGFLVSEYGDILTCFHVIGDCSSAEVYGPVIIKLGGVSYPVELVYTSPKPEILDFAVLRVQDKRLPEGAALIPLGLGISALTPRPFLSYGFRSPYLSDGGAAATGNILAARDYLGAKILNLSSESSDNQQMREGMSGAPILDVLAREIVGMFIGYSDENKREMIPMALSLASIGSFWEPLEDVLDEQRLWQELCQSGILDVNGQWLTQTAFDQLCNGFPWIPSIGVAGTNKEQILLQQLRERGKTSEFIDYLKACYPTIPIDDHIHRRRNVRFLNRQDEKRYACESLAPSYIFFEGPTGYGKTRLLEEIRKEHFRLGWLCIHLNIDDSLLTIDDLINQFREQLGLQSPPKPGQEDLTTKASMLAVRVIDRAEKMHGNGLLLTLDHAEKLPLELGALFVGKFLPALARVLGNGDGGKALSFRLRAAGRYNGAQWEEAVSPVILNVVMLSPFQFRYVEEAVICALPEQKNPESFAAHLMYASAGHPFCMAEAIKKLGSTTGDLDAHFIAHSAYLRSLTHQVAEEVRASMQKDSLAIVDTLERLCIFPVLDRRLLDLLIDENYIDLALDQFELEEILLGSHYYDPEENCLYDHIARRVLATDQRISDFDSYQLQCQRALDFYCRHFKSFESHSEKMFLAILELELELAALPYQPLNSDVFFGPNGILTRARQLLDGKPLAIQKHILTDLWNLLSHTERAWEFRFFINFVLRTGTFNNRPFDEFMRIIQDWKKALPVPKAGG